VQVAGHRIVGYSTLDKTPRMRPTPGVFVSTLLSRGPAYLTPWRWLGRLTDIPFFFFAPCVTPLKTNGCGIVNPSAARRLPLVRPPLDPSFPGHLVPGVLLFHLDRGELADYFCFCDASFCIPLPGRVRCFFCGFALSEHDEWLFSSLPVCPPRLQ